MIHNKECHTPGKGHRELNSMAVVLGEQENKLTKKLNKKNVSIHMSCHGIIKQHL